MTEMVKIVSPVDGRIYAQRETAGGAEINAAVSKARFAQLAWGEISVAQRAQLITGFVDVLLAMNDDIVPELAWQMGRPIRFGGEKRGVEERARHMISIAEAALAPGGAYRPIVAFGAKLAEHAGRLAAVLTLYGDPDAMEVPGEAMACGIALAQHYAAEMLRLQGASCMSPDLRLAAVLLNWWQGRGEPQCHLAAIYQRGPNALRDAATARRIIGILAAHGWVRPSPNGATVDGIHRNDVWELAA